MFFIHSSNVHRLFLQIFLLWKCLVINILRLLLEILFPFRNWNILDNFFVLKQSFEQVILRLKRKYLQKQHCKICLILLDLTGFDDS